VGFESEKLRLSVAFIVENGAPIELIEFTDPNHPDGRNREQL
jgi:hypothetical protein